MKKQAKKQPRKKLKKWRKRKADQLNSKSFFERLEVAWQLLRGKVIL